MRQKYLRAVGRMLVINTYCSRYTERGLMDRHFLVIHIPGVRKADFMRRCCIWHLAESLR